jgi:DNA-binding response OmpR family regulator
MSETITLVALIVESDSMIRAHIIERLNKHAIQCIEADNGMIALEQLENHRIDFVISDLQMKRMDGIQFIEIVHRNHKDIPVVASISSNDNETTIDAFRAGAVNVIKKVGSLDELEAIVLPITDLIEKRKSRYFDFKNVQYLTEELSIVNDPALIPVTVEHLLSYLKQSKFAERLTGLEVALYEMIANAIEHGNLAITKEQKEQALSESRFNELLLARRNNPHFKNRLVKIKLNYNSRQLTVTIAWNCS